MLLRAYGFRVSGLSAQGREYTSSTSQTIVSTLVNILAGLIIASAISIKTIENIMVTIVFIFVSTVFLPFLFSSILPLL